jgi:glycerate 2-kinase
VKVPVVMPHEGRRHEPREQENVLGMAPMPDWSNLHEDLAALHRAALTAVEPSAAVRRALRIEPGELVVCEERVDLVPSARVWLVALGKASLGMTRAAIEVIGERVAAAVIAHPHGADTAGPWPPMCRLHAGGHPLPDEGSLAAGAGALRMLESAEDGDVALVLVSGGGSAIFESLLPAVTLEDLRSVTQAVQHAGADILDLNTIRRALSRVKGGGLARAAGAARVATLILSDVVGDRLEAIASGPTVGSPTGPREALAVLDRLGLAARFPHVAEALRNAASTPRSPIRSAGRVTAIVGSNRIAAEALRAEAEARGFRAMLLTDRMQGEAREVGRLVGGIARGMKERDVPLPAPACLVIGGETTVTVRGKGRGGRNLELALGAALALDGCPRAAVFSFATDGVDGSSGAAGAIARGDTLARARALGRSAHAALAENDTAPFFAALDDLWSTGPSGTNVNDLAVLLAYPEPATRRSRSELTAVARGAPERPR